MRPEAGRLLAALPPGEPAGLAAELIRLPSVNPPGDEAAAVGCLERLLAGWGWRTERRDSPAGRANLTASRRFGPGGGRVILCGHLDVVPAGDPSAWRFPPFGGVTAEGRLWGRGAADMKGGAAALVWGARLLELTGPPAAGEVILHLVADEESGGDHGAGWLAAQGLCAADACLVAEPSGLRPVIAGKGVWWARIALTGRSAHAGAPEKGVNAVAAMARLIARLPELVEDAQHPLLGRPTATPTVIHGGAKVNQVPEACVLELDRRLLPGRDRAALEAATAAWLERFASVEGLSAGLATDRYAEPYVLPQDLPLLKTAMDALAAADIPQERGFGARGFTDARFYVAAGTPALVLGPGRLAQAHGPDEYVETAELRLAAVVYALMLRNLLAGTRRPGGSPP